MMFLAWAAAVLRRSRIPGLIGLVLCCALSVSAAKLGSGRFDMEQLKRIRADHWSVVGKNIILRGNVYLPLGDIEVYAHQAVVNLESQDIEASGNVHLFQWGSASGSIPPGKATQLMAASDAEVTITGVSGDIYGRKEIAVTAKYITNKMQMDRIVGNLRSGYFRFDKVQLSYSNFICRAESGERKPDGVITVTDAELSSCAYMESDNAHYSVAAKKMTFTPHNSGFYGVENIDTDIGDHSVFAVNGFVKVYGIPILWLPVFYKPKDESPGLFGMTWGSNSSWGYYFSAYRRFVLSDYPMLSVKLRADWYLLRGVGYGLDGEMLTESSRTEFFAYSIYDIRPFENDDYSRYLLRVPNGRFDFRVSNVTHITPRLDFRGVFEYASDYYFTRDFFYSHYANDPQPSTFAALEQQFDLMSASVYFRPRVNSFYTTVEKLPEVRLDVPRQQIFNTPFYYQGDLSAGYYRMKWIDFDFEPATRVPNDRLENYAAFRFDTTHFLYLPINLGWLNIVPRAGFKVTGYSKSSKTKVDEAELAMLFTAANPQYLGGRSLVNYDDKGGGKVRFAGELGVEVSTKIHNTWQNVRSNFLAIDGLRHVMRPYVNYTFISKPNVDRANLYYFDDVDRIQEENFFRIGVENRLQTRDSDHSIRNYLQMENYIDIHMGRQDGLSSIGNLCTILTFTPIRNLSIRSEFSIDAGNNNDDLEEVRRKGRSVGHPGLNVKWLNRWSLSISYKPISDVTLYLAYTYNRPYYARSAYSMGSTLTNIDAGSYFNNFFTDRSDQIRLGGTFPITPDRRTFMGTALSYDFIEGRWKDLSFTLKRRLHCWNVIAQLSFSRDDDASSGWETSFSIQAELVGLEAPMERCGAGSMLSSSGGGFGSGAHLL